MKNFLVIALFALAVLSLQVSGQITIQTGSLPTVGYRHLTNFSPGGPRALPPGDSGVNQTWNFTIPAALLDPDTTTYLTAANSRYIANFRNASLINKLDTAGPYLYYSTGAGGLKLMGVAGLNNGIPGLPIPFPVPFPPSITITPALDLMIIPMTMGANVANTYRMPVTIPVDSNIRRALAPLVAGVSAGGVPINVNNITNMRATFVLKQAIRVNGWGTLSTNGANQQIPVLRTTTRRTNSVELEIQYQLLPSPFPAIWVPVPLSAIPGGAGGVTGGFLPSGNQVDYWSNQHKLSLLSIPLDSMGMGTNMTYQPFLYVTSNKTRFADVVAQLVPNPAKNVAQVYGLPSEPMAYQITNPLGQVMSQGVVSQQDNQLALAQLSTGIYTVAIGKQRLRLVVE